jgi:16S rRNA A1518/A1519 N6-dimethyltransferase RsmA/KsgA/DIM1 with predicted DNA glycosylase/AP lyase activity
MPLIVDPADLELNTLRALLDFAGQRVVEIGAGDARLAWPLAPETARWVALEPDTEEMEAARAELREQPLDRLRLVIGDGRALALPSCHFDLALFTWSLC